MKIVHLSPTALLLCLIACTPATDTRRPSSDLPLVVTETESPATGDARDPELTTTRDGKVLLSWVERAGENSYALRFAVHDQNGWSEPKTVGQGNNWFVNWADFPSVIGFDDGSMAAHWLVKNGASKYAYDVNVARSPDGGKTWTKAIVPHLDHTQTEHGFVSLVALPDRRVGAVWLDGRNMGSEGDEMQHPGGSMTLRYAAIDKDGKLSEEMELDDRVCECCQTSAAVTNDGVVAVYRDRSANELRDIYSVRQKDSSWSAPQAVHADNWQINACPVNGPSIAAEGNRVVVAWFTGAENQSQVNVAFSEDGGGSYRQAIQVDDGETIGRVDVVLLEDGSALVCWLSGTVEAGAIKVRRVTSNGMLGPITNIAKTDISRSSGFPRVARAGNVVHFAWTEFGKPARVKTAKADVTAYRLNR